MSAFKTWDTETTIATYLKRKASPFFKDNYVVTHAFASKGEAPVEYRFGRRPPADGWFAPVLHGTRLLAGFNLKFDIHHAIVDQPLNLEAWMDYVANGGNIWDCQLAEYLLNGMGQRDHMLALDEVAPRYGGNVKIDEVKALWEAGVDTPDIDPELLTRYLVGGKDEFGVWQEGDIGNTEKIALAQIARAREVGQLNSILLNMGGLLGSIEMERNGMYVDKELGLKIAAELTVEVAKLKEALHEYLPKDMPFEFNWGSWKQKSALIFGGTVEWDAYEYDLADGGTIYRHHWEEALAEFDGSVSAMYCVDPGMRRLYSQMDVQHCYRADTGELIPLEQAKAEGIPVVRYSSGKREGEVKTKMVKVDNPDKPKGRSVKAPYTFPRITEPKQAWASSEPGFWSTNSDIIEELGDRNIPFLKVMAELQTTAKDLGTYYISEDENGKQKGMLTLVGLDGLIHHRINHSSTVTGRLSSSDPNLQNLSRSVSTNGRKPSKVRTLFISRWGIDGSIIASDFKSLEIYIQAILTKCKQLILDLQAGLDMHCLRLANTEGLPYDDVLKLAKGDKKEGKPADPVWDAKRTDSKIYSFQAAYGAGDSKIAGYTGMGIERVAALRAADDQRYPEINEYFSRRTDEIKANRKPSGTAVPHPEFPGVMCNLGRSAVRTPDGKLYSYMESPSPGYLVKRGITASFSPTEIKNYEVQGEGGEWAKAAMELSVRAFYKRRNFGGLALLVNQVHDAEYADAHKTVEVEAAALLHACMEAASDYMEYKFGWHIPVPVPSDTKAGPNMAEGSDVPGLKELAAKFRLELRQDYMQGYVPSFA